MVPCLGCGRYFCRLCDPPGGAGQYCPRCFEESVSRLAGKESTRKSRLRSLFTREEVAGEPEGEAPTVERTGRRRAERAVTKPARAKSAHEKAPGVFRKAAGRVRTALATVPGVPGRALRYTGREIKAHFPVGLKDTERLEGMPPLAEKWPWLAGFTAGGTVLWALVVGLTHVRAPWYSIGVGLIVAVGIAWSLGPRFDPQVGLVALCLVVLSLVLGELFVQVLYRLNVIKKLDISKLPFMALNERKALFYQGYFYTLLVHRLLPSAVLAFLIGWWPLPKRPSWLGFGHRGAETKVEGEAS